MPIEGELIVGYISDRSKNPDKHHESSEHE